MCFSATASYASAAVLLPAGAYAMITARRMAQRYMLFASIPFVFGLQQLLEGLIWNFLHAGYHVLAHNFSIAYLFFAFFWWPVIIPVSVYRIETDAVRKKLLRILSFAGLLLALVLYAPILAHVKPISTGIVGGSINYLTYTNPWVISIYILCYSIVVFASLLLSSVRGAGWFGMLLFLAIIVSLVWYLVVFTSVWCFFAALLSLCIVYFIPSSLSRN